MKTLLTKLLHRLATFAFALGLIGSIGGTCRTILYQPKVPQRLLDMDK